MINRRNASRLLCAFWPSDCRMPRFEIMAAIADVDRKLSTESGQYDSLGDTRQAVLVVISMQGGGELVDVIKHETDPAKVAKLIKADKWAKRKANRKAAPALACQYENDKPCSNAKGCSCNG